MKIGILGGTFDPIHQGHLSLAKAARTQFLLKKVYFVPAHQSPHKSGHRSAAPALDRYRMVQRALEGEKFFEVSDLEMRRLGISYTLDTILEFKRQFPKDEFYLILGADAFQSFPSWKDSKRIEKEAALLVAPRPGEKLDANRTRAHRITMTEVAISSTGVRRELEQRMRLDESWIPRQVMNYILEHQLYQASSG